jgi:hypothetical protein
MNAQSTTIDGDDRGSVGPAVLIQLLHVPDCPLVDQVRATLRTSMAKTTIPVMIEEIEGPYPSPTLLIDGQDVSGRSAVSAPSCRLDLPTEEQVLAALSSTRPGAPGDAADAR